MGNVFFKLSRLNLEKKIKFFLLLSIVSSPRLHDVPTHLVRCGCLDNLHHTHGTVYEFQTENTRRFIRTLAKHFKFSSFQG